MSTELVKAGASGTLVRPIHGYEGRYSVTIAGNVISEKSQQILKADLNRHGYRTVRLYKGTRASGAVKYVHRLVAEAFIGPCPAGYQVNHVDGDKGNNHAKNLEYVTPAENIAHAEHAGLRPKKRGADHPNARLTENEVLAIRRRAAEGEQQRVLANEYGVSESHLHRILKRAVWAHVEGT